MRGDEAAEPEERAVEVRDARRGDRRDVEACGVRGDVAAEPEERAACRGDNTGCDLGNRNILEPTRRRNKKGINYNGQSE